MRALPLTVPNVITVVRVGLVPLFVFLSYGQSAIARALALAVFLLASLSDFLDGHLARRNDDTSRAGEWLDPLADKLLVGSALVVLVALRGWPLWGALVIAARELGVQVLRTRIVQGGGTLPASLAGKAKTVLQITTLAWWLFPWPSLNTGHWVLFTLTLAVTVVSGGEYFIAAFKGRSVKVAS